MRKHCGNCGNYDTATKQFTEICSLCVSAIDDSGETTPPSKWKPKPQTNADRIRAMSDEELADVIMCPMEIGASKDLCENNLGHTCVECSLRWLQQPAKEEV